MPGRRVASASLLIGFLLTGWPAYGRVVAKWRFEEGIAGNAAFGANVIFDSSGNQITATPFGSPTYLSDAGMVPGSSLGLKFNGVNSRIGIPDKSLLALTHSLTLDAYIRIDGPVSGCCGVGQIVFRGDDRGGFDPYFLGIDSTGRLTFHIGDAANNAADLNSPNPLPTGVYLRVTGSLDDATGIQRLFVNGALVNSQVIAIRPFGLMTGPNPGLGIGSTQSPTLPELFNGVIDEVTIRDDPEFFGAMLTFSGGDVNTVAGNGSFAFGGDGGLASSALLNQPTGVAVDGANIYFADLGNFRIRKIDAAGFITTVAGNGTRVSTGDGGPAASASIQTVYNVALDAAGNLYIPEYDGHRVRKVDRNGTITTVAGTGVAGYSGDNGPATSAQLNLPHSVAVDGGGNLYIADSANYRIRRVDLTGTITTIAGTGTYGYSGDGGAATNAQFRLLENLVFDGSGNLFAADPENHVVRQVNSQGMMSTVAGNGTSGSSGDGGPATLATLKTPEVLALDGAHNLYIGDTGSSTIRRVDASGMIQTVAGTGIYGYSGDGGPALNAQFALTWGLAVDTTGSLYVADSQNNRLRRIDNTTAQLSFGTVNLGQTSAPKILQLTNPGTSALNLLSTAISKNFQLASTGVTNNCIGLPSLAPQASCNYGVQFAPVGTPGPITGTLTFTDNAANSPQTVTLSGTATFTASLSISKTHVGSFTQGQNGAAYTVVVSNAAVAGVTVGAVTVTEVLPAGLTLASMSGNGWSCTANVCVRYDPLGFGSTYPPITVLVNVAAAAPATVTNTVQLSGGSSPPATANDPTTITPPPVQVTVGTSPVPGLPIRVDSVQYASPQTFAWIPGSTHSIAVSGVETTASGAPGTQYSFTSWTDGGGLSHTVTAPALAGSLVANFTVQYLLSTFVSPSGAGGISPATGYYDQGTLLLVAATANSGYQFSAYSGTLKGTTNPQGLTLNGPATIVANYATLTPRLTSSVGLRSDGTVAGTRNVTLSLLNAGLGTAANATISSISAITVIGGSGTVAVASGAPVNLGSISPGASASGVLLFNWPATATRVRFTVNFTADGGYQGSTVITSFR